MAKIPQLPKDSKIRTMLFDAANALVDAAAKLRARCVVVIMVGEDFVCLHNGSKEERDRLLRETMREDVAQDERRFLGPRKFDG